MLSVRLVHLLTLLVWKVTKSGWFATVLLSLTVCTFVAHLVGAQP